MVDQCQDQYEREDDGMMAQINGGAIMTKLMYAYSCNVQYSEFCYN